ncbi:MAG: glycyl-radical enzyme activating protein [Streptococcaceae bacterium]|jgi:pyruvate formate lyase activating enzyme|nr:glycyl-radical enzyme activating protein [Streptococcaceae bacterium]
MTVETACVFNVQKFSIHDGPGIRTVIFFKGCPLRCFWCANPESQNKFPEKMRDDLSKLGFVTVGENKSYDELIDEVMKDALFYEESGGGVTVSGGEVLMQAAFATELLRRLKEKGIHTAAETTGFAKPAVFADFLAQVDYLFFDVKHWDAAQHRRGTGADLQVILENLKMALSSGVEMWPRIPVIPGFNDGLENARGFAKLFHEIGVTRVELLPFHQFGEKKYELLGRDYRLKDEKQFQTTDLLYFKEILEEAGISCKV